MSGFGVCREFGRPALLRFATGPKIHGEVHAGVCKIAAEMNRVFGQDIHRKFSLVFFKKVPQ
jgi:hypothetical protein